MRLRRGSHAIEFALCLPLWFAVIAAIADYGWLFYRYTALDAATDEGCRAGSIVDPGNHDQRIAAVQAAAEARMLAVLSGLYDDDCRSCTVETYTVGEPPVRSLVCRATREFEPLVGLFVTHRSLTTLQIARLEWQHERAGGES